MRHRFGVIALALLAPCVARAQLVRGTVVESGTGQPLYGSIIVLLDSTGVQVTGAITDERGRFTLPAPAPGRYTLRANRIGFQSTRSDSFTLSAGQTLEQRLVASALPIELATIRVTGKERCTTRPEEGHAAFTVWEEVRTALTAATLTQQQRLLNVRIRRFERDVDQTTRHVQHEQSWEQSGLSSAPFVAIGANTLERNGYALLTDTASWYYAPDADVLLSDAFSAHHCFRVQQSDSEPTRLIGLAFQPVRDRKVPDVQGVLWLDRATGELRSMEFHYVRLPRAIPKNHFGGELKFRRLPNGAWIVQRWVLHLPVVGRITRRYGVDTVIAAVHETGGAVLTASTRDGTLLSLTETATLHGTVFDSTRGAPLAGALVVLAGTGDSTRTDSAGVFQLEGLGTGQYDVVVSHARLDSLALGPLARHVTLRSGIISTAQLAVPPFSSIVRDACPDSLRGPSVGLVAGTVRDWDSRRPVVNALVTVSWKTWQVDPHTVVGSGHGIEVSSDSVGHYHACGVPVGLPLTVTAQMGDRKSERVTVPPLNGGDLVLRDVRVAAGTSD